MTLLISLCTDRMRKDSSSYKTCNLLSRFLRVLIFIVFSSIASPIVAFDFPFNIQLENSAHEIAIDPTREIIYVSVPEENAIVFVSSTDLRIIDKVFVGSRPRGISLSENGNILYIALNGAGGVAILDLTSKQITDTINLTNVLGTSETWDVIEAGPDDIFVSANPNGFGFLVRVNPSDPASASRIANEEWIDHSPRFTLSPLKDFLYVNDTDFNLYKLDISQPLAPLVLEEGVDSLFGTSHLAPSSSGTTLHTWAGQIISTTSFEVISSLPSGIPRFSSMVDDRLHIASEQSESSMLVRTFNTSLLTEISSTSFSCNIGNRYLGSLDFRVLDQDAGFVGLGDTQICGTLQLPDNPNGYLFFQEISYAANEVDGAVNLEICRGGGSTGIVSASLQSTDGTAIENEHYIAPPASVVFADGDDTCKAVVVTLIDDPAPSANDRFFELRVQNPQGGATLIQSTTQVTIIDDDAGPLPAEPTILAETYISESARDMARDEQRDLIYVTTPTSNEILAISSNTFEIVNSITIPFSSYGINLSLDHTRLFVALYGGGSVGIVDLDTFTLTGTIDVSTELGDPRTWDVIETAPNILFVSTSPGGNGFGYIARVDLADSTNPSRVAGDKIIRTNPVFDLSNDQSRLYVTDQDSIYRLDLESVDAPIIAEDNGRIGGAVRMDSSPDNSLIQLGSGKIFDAESMTHIGSTAGGFPLFSQSGETIYVAPSEGDAVSEYDLVLANPVASYPMGCPELQYGATDFKFFESKTGFIVLRHDGVCASFAPPNGYLYFPTGSIQINEMGGAVDIEVCRGGNSDGMVSGMISTVSTEIPSDNDAIEGQHYIPVSNFSLIFNDGESGCQTTSIQIIDDITLSNDLTFSVELVPANAESRIAKYTGGDPQFLQTSNALMSVEILEDDLDFSILMTPDQTTVVSGEEKEFLISIANSSSGNQGANATFALEIPGNVEFISTSLPENACAISDSITCNLGTIAGNETSDYSIVFRIIGSGASTLTGSVVSDDVDRDQSNNSVTVNLTIIPLPPAEELVPLIPGTTWNYAEPDNTAFVETVLENLTIFGGISATGIQRSDTGNVDFYSNENEFLLFVTTALNGAHMEMSPGVKLMNEAPSLGDTIMSQGQLLYEIPGMDPLSVPYLATATLLDYYYGYVPNNYGSGYVALIELTLNASGVSSGHAVDFTLTRTYTLSHGIGRIWQSEEFLNNLTSDTFYSSRSLVGFSFPDTDEDGLTDDIEIIQGLNRLSEDSDNDELTDGFEVNVAFTNPLSPDSDGDGATDGFEISMGFDPLDPNSTPPEVNTIQIRTLPNQAIVILFGFLIAVIYFWHTGRREIL